MCPPEVGLELGDHGEGLQEQPAERVVPVVDGCAQAGQDAAAGQVGQDLVGLGHLRANRSNFVTGEDAAIPHGGEG
jgi:hypothetical protein